MKRFLLAICLMFVAFGAQAEKRALVIGIGNYPDVDYGWHTINGNNDIAIVCEMLRCNGFLKKHIHTLCDAQATYKGITSALSQIIAQSGKGDVVYIHFSGHGQQITDLNGDEAEGYDESWVPYDALQEPTSEYHGQYHISDDLLNAELLKLKNKVGDTGKIIVVSDACHSGSGTRVANDDSVIRGSSAKFILTASKVPYSKSNSIQWISISACADKECNRQCKASDGTRYGSLSYTLYQMRNALNGFAMDELGAKLKGMLCPPLIARPQTPQVEYAGSAQQHLFE